MGRLEDLTKGALVKGVLGDRVVKVVDIAWYGSSAVTPTYTDELTGKANQELLYREDEARLVVQKAGLAWSMDADGNLFRLVSEAKRISLAYLFDPFLAVQTSTLRTLPHQIDAVYNKMMPRQPLRFLLADDLGAGKTIMAGLFCKELMIRGDVERCLIIAPGSLVEQWQDELWQKFALDFTTTTDEVHGLVLLPTHPLRLAWVAAHDQLLRGWAEETTRAGKTRPARSSRIDFDLISRLSPANLPFITVDPDAKPFVYAEELTYGSALYLPPTTDEPQSDADVICRVIDVPRDSVELTISADALGDRFRSYRGAHPGTAAMRIMAVNPGSGALLRMALTPLVLPSAASDDDPLPADPPRVEVIAYSDRLSYTEPVADLQALQRSVSSAEMRHAATHLTPLLGLAARDLARLTEDHEGTTSR